MDFKGQMMEYNDKMKNPAAFPAHHMWSEDDFVNNNGMTLLDYFAGQVIISQKSGTINTAEGDHKIFAEQAYRIASAMLKEREKYLDK